MNLDKETALIEAILFLETDPVDEKALCRISGLPKDAVEKILQNIKDSYSSEDHGIELLMMGGGYIFSPKKELWNI
jgi:segregation and condensation protein B